MTIKLDKELLESKVVLLGDHHSREFWEYNEKAILELKPDYLLLEVLGIHRALNKKERDKLKKSYVYMNDSSKAGYNSDVIKIADELDIPMIGIDTWNKPYEFPKEWDEKDKETNYEYSHRIREARMTRVLKKFEDKGKVLLIVGAEHLREDSELRIYADEKKYKVKFFKL